MGPSGSGKSSLLYVLGGLEPPTSGVVRLGERRAVRARQHADLRCSATPTSASSFRTTVCCRSAPCSRTCSSPRSSGPRDRRRRRARADAAAARRAWRAARSPARRTLRRREAARGDRARAHSLAPAPALRRADRQSRRRRGRERGRPPARTASPTSRRFCWSSRIAIDWPPGSSGAGRSLAASSRSNATMGTLIRASLVALPRPARAGRRRRRGRGLGARRRAARRIVRAREPARSRVEPARRDRARRGDDHVVSRGVGGRSAAVGPTRAIAAAAPILAVDRNGDARRQPPHRGPRPGVRHRRSVSRISRPRIGRAHGPRRLDERRPRSGTGRRSRRQRPVASRQAHRHPAEQPAGPARRCELERIRLTAARTLDRAALGEFSLLPSQGPALSLFVPLSSPAAGSRPRGRGQCRADSDGRRRHRRRTRRRRASSRRSSRRAQLDDLGLTVRRGAADTVTVLESRSGLIPDDLARAALRSAAEGGATAVGALTYLANSIRAGGREIPYSVISAMDLEAYGRLARLRLLRPITPTPRHRGHDRIAAAHLAERVGRLGSRASPPAIRSTSITFSGPIRTVCKRARHVPFRRHRADDRRRRRQHADAGVSGHHRRQRRHVVGSAISRRHEARAARPTRTTGTRGARRRKRSSRSTSVSGCGSARSARCHRSVRCVLRPSGRIAP